TAVIALTTTGSALPLPLISAQPLELLRQEPHHHRFGLELDPEPLEQPRPDPFCERHDFARGRPASVDARHRVPRREPCTALAVALPEPRAPDQPRCGELDPPFRGGESGHLLSGQQDAARAYVGLDSLELSR